MQMLFRFMPAIIYAASLFAIVSLRLIVRPPHARRPFNLHCKHATYPDCRFAY